MSCVIIPAHNEATVINRTLVSLLQWTREDDQILVVCNGCSDNTAEVARSVSPRISVLETSVPSKTGALNLGEKSARAFPRIYLDADVVLTDGSLQALEQALETGPWLAASPEPVMDFSSSSWAVRAYYDIWLSMPYCQSGLMGAGVYALSETGRARFEWFPDLIADDGYVRALFKEDERGRAKNCKAIVKAPSNLHWLIKIKTRSRLGTMELALKYPELVVNEVKDYRGGISNVLRDPKKWLKCAIYLYVNLVSRFLAQRQMGKLEEYEWQKDTSSR